MADRNHKPCKTPAPTGNGSEAQSRVRRLPYTTPRVQAYGSLSSLTQQGSNIRPGDPGGASYAT